MVYMYDLRHSSVPDGAATGGLHLLVKVNAEAVSGSFRLDRLLHGNCVFSRCLVLSLSFGLARVLYAGVLGARANRAASGGY